ERDGKEIVRVWREPAPSPEKVTVTTESLKVFQGHRGQVNAGALSPDGTLVLSGSGDRTARLWNAKTGTELEALPGHTEYLWAVAFSPDGKLALTAGGGYREATGEWKFGEDFAIRVWDVATRKEVGRLKGHTQSVNSVTFSSDGKQVLSSGSL